MIVVETEGPAGPESSDASTGSDDAVVVVWAADALAAPRGARDRPPRPVVAERVSPGAHVVVGRRASDQDPARGPDGDGVRLALEQRRQPRTSRRHLELVHDGRWSVQILPGVKVSSGLRLWGQLSWEEAPAGTRRPLEPHRPIAWRLPGEPGYVVATVVAGAAGRPAPPEPAPGSTSVVDPPEPVRLSRHDRETLARIYRVALQWPPRPEDDPPPTWARLPQDEALRAGYREIRARAEGPLGIPPGRRAPDELLLRRLISSGALTWDDVAGVADACDVPLWSPRVDP